MSFLASKWLILIGGLVILGHQLWLHFQYADQKPVQKPNTWQQFLSLLTVGLGITAVGMLVFDVGHMPFIRNGMGAVVRAIGALLFISGVGVRIWSLNSLQENYAPDLRIKSGMKLIRSGAYAWLRHPFYLSVFSLAFGAGLALENWIVLIFALGLVPVVRQRIRLEEDMLLEYFQEEYRHYRERVPMLFPGLSRGKYQPEPRQSLE